MVKLSTNNRTKIPNFDSETRILIVDGDEIFAKFFKIHLNKYFSKVFVTGSSKEALQLFEASPFDLVITDVNLPRIDGSSLVKRIRKLNGTTPFIFMTDSILTDGQKEKLGDCAALLPKPFTLKQLHTCLRQGLVEKHGKPSNFLKESLALLEEE